MLLGIGPSPICENLSLSPAAWYCAMRIAPAVYSDVVQNVNHATRRVIDNLARFSEDLLVFREKPCIRTDTGRIEIDSGVTG